MKYITRWTVIGLVVGCIVGLALGAGYWSLFAVLAGVYVGRIIGEWVPVFRSRRRKHKTHDSGGHVRIVDHG